MDGQDEQPSFTGTFGFLVRPDSVTIERAVHMGSELAPDVSYRVTEALAHITLYHAPFVCLPREKVTTLLMSLRTSLRRMECRLGVPSCYGGKFLFWDMIDIPIGLRLAHEACLMLAKHLDLAVRSRAEREGLKMSDAERRNAIEYGHPLVRDLFRPHITLGARESGISEPHSFWALHGMTVETVVFAEIGEWGTPARIIEP